MTQFQPCGVASINRPLFSRILCISLLSRPDRREHATRELGRLDLARFEWIDAFGKASEAVVEAFEAGRVRTYPPCFRCGKPQCQCDNRRLMPEQVGAWLSHEQAWRAVAEEGLTLVCEDDVRFTKRAKEAFAWLEANHDLQQGRASERPLLVRLGRALEASHDSEAPFQLTSEPTMSNPCYALNRPMAESLLAGSQAISTTVDIYVHRSQGPNAWRLTLEPPLASELSWSTGEFRSDIRPKRAYIEQLEAKLNQLVPGTDAYGETERAIESERERFERFHRYNAVSGDIE